MGGVRGTTTGTDDSIDIALAVDIDFGREDIEVGREDDEAAANAENDSNTEVGIIRFAVGV